MARKQQRGLSFITLLLFIGVVAAIGIMVARTLPSVMEYQAVVKAVNKASSEPTPQEVRAAFDRAAQVDNITTISGRDLEIAKEGNASVVSFAYQKEFHMFGPAWLTLKYEGSSRGR